MNIKLYNMTSDKIVVPKSKQEKFDLSGDLIEETDIINPSIRIYKRDDYITKCNYAYITEFGRYYYIDNIIIENNEIIRLDLSIDTLETYWENIKKIDMHITRSENEYNMYLTDPLMMVTSRTNKQVKLFRAPSGGYFFNNSVSGVGGHSYILNAI